MFGNRRLALVGLGLGLALAACGTDDASSTPTSATESVSSTPTPSEPPSEPASETAPATPTATASDDGEPVDAPLCSDIWQDGAKLPRTYAGCVAKGEFVKRDVLACSSGQRLVRFDEAFYAVLGGKIAAAKTSPLNKDDDYLDIVNVCRG